MIPNFVQENAGILLNEPLADELYLMRLHAPRIARTCRPGQFVQVETHPGYSPFLRRPFSVLRAGPKAGWIEILYDAVGTGTQQMARACPGRSLGLVGPLGLPFSPPVANRLLLVAGGVGLAPLAFLVREYGENRPDTVFLMGAASHSRMPDMGRLLPPGLEVHLATDDGSVGYHGLVTDLVANHVGPGTTVVFTCGPHPMMARVAAITENLGLPCYASLENHVACGFGACMGCVVEYRNPEREDRRYRRICVEGPVVDAHAIVW